MNLSINKNLYKDIIRSTSHINSKNINLKFCYSNHSKIGFILPSSLGPAHERNLFKRRCRSSFVNKNKINKNMAVLVKPKTLNLQFNEIDWVFTELYSKF